MTMRNWCYGAKTPDVEQDISDAIFAAHRYRNRLCELERNKRERHYNLLRELAPEFLAAELAVTEAEAELERIREAIQAERVKQKTKTPKGIGHLTQQASQCKALLKERRLSLKLAKHAAYDDPDVIAAMEANTCQHKRDCAEAKSTSGLYWGTEAIVSQACGSFASGAPPRFKRYDGTGQLAVQLQGGLDCEHAERWNTLFFLGNELDSKRRECYIRIGSEAGKPVFACVPIVFHRPLPLGKIKWAYLERRKIADHVRWTIRLTIDVDNETAPTLPGEVAIHTGWRMENGSLRVATVLGSDGKYTTLRLSESHCEQYLEIDAIKSRRDQSFNLMKIKLADWLRDRELPEWLDESRRYLHLWKSQARLASLYWRWVDERIAGDEEIFASLNQWRKTDKHEWQHERRLSIRIVRRRKDIYRKFVHSLSKVYGVAIVSPIDAKELTENSEPEQLERDNTAAHRHAKWAAVSDLTQIIKEKFLLHCVDVDHRNISQECSKCGECQSVGERFRQCRACGYSEDIDERAVINTLARGQAAINSGALLELVAEQELKAEKQRDKLLKMQEANRTARKKGYDGNENKG